MGLGPLPRGPRCAGDAGPARPSVTPRWDDPRRTSPRRGGASGGRIQVTGGASADGRGARDGPRLARARVDGGLRAPACAAREARVRRWVRIWSITDAWVMNAMIRMGPRQVGHARGSTSKSCWSRGCPPAGGLRRRQPWCGDDRGRRIGDGGLGLPPHGTRSIGIPARVPRGDVARVGDVHQHPGRGRERVHRLGARRRAVRRVRAVRRGLRGPVVAEPFQRDRIRAQYRGARGASRTRDRPRGPEAVCTWNPECGQVSMPEAWSVAVTAETMNAVPSGRNAMHSVAQPTLGATGRAAGPKASSTVPRRDNFASPSGRARLRA